MITLFNSLGERKRLARVLRLAIYPSCVDTGRVPVVQLFKINFPWIGMEKYKKLFKWVSGVPSLRCRTLCLTLYLSFVTDVHINKNFNKSSTFSNYKSNKVAESKSICDKMLKTSNVLVYIVLTDKHQSKSLPQNFHAEISKAIKSTLSLKISEESRNALKGSLFSWSANRWIRFTQNIDLTDEWCSRSRGLTSHSRNRKTAVEFDVRRRHPFSSF